jgi:hypothetical protein
MVMNTVKAPNYTEEQEAELRECYTAKPTREIVDMLADKYGKSPRSIISKLSNMGIYKAPPRTTKAGTPIVKKETLVKEICDRLGIDAPSLVKANKQDLERMVEVVRELGAFEGVID